MTWTFEVDDAPSPEALASAKSGTKAARGANFICVLTGAAIDDKHVKSEAKAGRMGHRMIAMVAQGVRSRIYLPPSVEQETLALSLRIPELPGIEQAVPEKLTGGTCYGYGLTTFDRLFTARQLTALECFVDLVEKVRELVISDAADLWAAGNRSYDDRRLSEGGTGLPAYADAVATYLAFTITNITDRNSNIVGWASNREHARNVFARQSIPMVWDFAESNVLSDSSGNFFGGVTKVANAIENLPARGQGEIIQAAAQQIHLERVVISTDPPYYDNIAYADLSDYFYVWLRVLLGNIHPGLFRRMVTPKSEELVAASYRHGGRDSAERFFMAGMTSVMHNFASSELNEPTTIYYAFKQSEASIDGITSAGWASFLQAVVDSGFLIDGTWPVRTEIERRFVSQDTNALASSIVLVCRRRDAGAETITRPDFLRRLRAEIPAALATIRAAGVGPTDIQQAAIGPGIGIFTRYASVLNTDGEPMNVREALKLVNQVREEIASEGEGDYDAETRFAIEWFVAHGFALGKSGGAIGMANAANLGITDLERAGVLETKGGDARLLRRTDMPANWDPRKDKRPTAWEACQHLIRRLEAEDGGIDAAAQLFAILGDLADPAHQLAFRLYDICETKGWHAEGRPYNLLIQEWAEIENRAFALRDAPPAQGEMAV